MDIWLPWSHSADKQDWGPWIVCYRKLSVPSVEFWGSGDAFSNSNVMEDRKKLGSSENCRNVGGGIAERLVENFLYRSLGAGVDNLINTSHAKIRTLRSELVFQEGWRWRYWKLFLFFSFCSRRKSMIWSFCTFQFVSYSSKILHIVSLSFYLCSCFSQ